jgi:hypothetical protein
MVRRVAWFSRDGIVFPQEDMDNAFSRFKVEGPNIIACSVLTRRLQCCVLNISVARSLDLQFAIVICNVAQSCSVAICNVA